MTRLLACAFCGLALAPASLRAQETVPVETPLIDLTKGVSIELSPHTGIMGGSGTFGLRFSMNYGAFNFELAGEQVIGRTANLYPISVNALLNLSTKGNLFPYGVVGGGLMLTVPTTTVGDQTVSTLSVNFGGGARYYLNSLFGLRLEGKQYITSVRNERDQNDELLFFQEVSLGVTFLFR